MYNVNAIKKALGKRRMSKIQEFDADVVGNFIYSGMCFDILMKSGWTYEGGTMIVFEARPEEYTQAEVIHILKDEIDLFEYSEEAMILDLVLQLGE